MKDPSSPISGRLSQAYQNHRLRSSTAEPPDRMPAAQSISHGCIAAQTCTCVSLSSWPKILVFCIVGLCQGPFQERESLFGAIITSQDIIAVMRSSPGNPKGENPQSQSHMPPTLRPHLPKLAKQSYTISSGYLSVCVFENPRVQCEMPP